MGESLPVQDRLSRGICLLCEAEVRYSERDDVEAAFFLHYAEEHLSAEPMYTIVSEVADAE